jgi:hypothetical protein
MRRRAMMGGPGCWRGNARGTLIGVWPRGAEPSRADGGAAGARFPHLSANEMR